MKKSIATCLLAFCFLAGNCQAKTSLADFIYITSALLDDLKTGRGIKAGYSIENILEFQTITVPGDAEMKVGLGYLKNGEQNVAVVLIAINNTNGNYKTWCIPTAGSDKEIWDRAYRTYQIPALAWSTAAMYGLTKALSLKLL